MAVVRLLLLIIVFTCIRPSRADERKAVDTKETLHESEILFVRRVFPLLREKCVACHGADPEAIEGSLDVRSLEKLQAGGDSGDPAIVPGEPEQSPLYLAVRRDADLYSPMPPKEAGKFTAEQLDWIRRWIETGAAWPSDERQEKIEAEYSDRWSVEDGVTMSTSGGLSEDWTTRRYDPAGLWAYQPLQKIDTTAARFTDRNPIDVFIEEALPEGLSVAPPADRRTLIRRATFDLTGLPPTPEQVRSFVKDPGDQQAAFAKVVDRLLKSPHYGERMAQHWLDVVRYADSSGFANDYERGNAWRYRDYVIRSFNEDKPYDQFVREQIASDEMLNGDPEGLIAVGFLRMGPWELTGMEVARIARQRFLDDVTNSVGETFLAHSLQCARCHDHKFDPVPTRDYYSIQAVFATTQLAERRAEFLDTENTSGFEERRFYEQERRAHEESLDQIRRQLLLNAADWFDEQVQQGKPEFADYRDRWHKLIAKAERENKGDPFGYARNQFMKDNVPEQFVPSRHVGLTPNEMGRERVARKGLERLKWVMDRYQPYALSVYNGHTPSMTGVYAPLRMPKDRTKGELEQSHILTGGDPFGAGPAVSPDTLSVLDDQLTAQIPTSIDGRRTAFAKWVTDPGNPLTPRVITNRLWLWHFNEPIAANPNNFGSTGGRPTHPKLLDYLAARLMKHGWSIKALHRDIMLSDAYQRSASHPNSDVLDELDPAGRSLAVFKTRRLSAEEMRDAMLAVTGELNPKIGGIPARPEINIEVALQPRQVMGTFAPAWVPNPQPEQRHRRSIYAMKLRGLMYPLLEVLNSPSPDFSCERREASTVTPQVFSLFNGQNSYARALAMADRAWRESEEAGDNRRTAAVQRCFELAYSRPANSDEMAEVTRHWDRLLDALPEKPRSSPHVPVKVKREAVEENTGERFTFDERLFSNAEFEPDLQPADVTREVRGLADICLVILNSNEFVYVY